MIDHIIYSPTDSVAKSHFSGYLVWINDLSGQ